MEKFVEVVDGGVSLVGYSSSGSDETCMLRKFCLDVCKLAEKAELTPVQFLTCVSMIQHDIQGYFGVKVEAVRAVKGGDLHGFEK
jgi:hypothetical protein